MSPPLCSEGSCLLVCGGLYNCTLVRYEMKSLGGLYLLKVLGTPLAPQGGSADEPCTPALNAPCSSFLPAPLAVCPLLSV